jgi:hypothetical protein
MNRMVIVLLVMSAGRLFGAAPAYFILPFPQDFGFSGFINLGTGAITAKSNTIAGNNLATIGKERISTCTPDSAPYRPALSGRRP